MTEWEKLHDAAYGLHLPIFPAFYDPPSEERLERVIERLTDFADRALMEGRASQVHYDRWIKRLDEWAKSVPIAA